MKVRQRAAWAMVLLLTAGPPVSTAGREDVIHSFGYISMKDGAQISYTLHRPSAQGCFPTLLVYNMYDASAVAPNWNQTVSTEVSDYLEEGFAVMGANVRGTACSSGTLDPLDAEQVGTDGAEVIEWIARGYLKVSMRERDPQASRQGSPVYRFKNSLPLRPGEVTPLEIELHPTGSIIEAGNALELLVMAPMMVPEPLGQWGFMPLPMAINTIHMSPEYRSRVLLPFVD